MVTLKKFSQQNHVGDRTKNLFAIILSCLNAGIKPVRLQDLNVDKTYSPAQVGPLKKKFSSFLLLLFFLATG